MEAVVLMPVHGAIALARKCLESLSLPARLWPLHIYDDASPEPFEPPHECWHLRNETPMGYAHAINTAALWAVAHEYDTLVVLNSDTLWPVDAMHALVDGLGNADFAGPSLSRAGSGQGPDAEVLATGGDMVALERLQEDRSGAPNIRPIFTINGAAMALRVHTWLECGPLDERFGRGAGEEEEWCRRVSRIRGRPAGVHVWHSVVWHEKGASWKEADARGDTDSASQWRHGADALAAKEAANEDHAWMRYPRRMPQWVG